MPIDNQLYDRLADTWWDENQFLNLLRSTLNPVRFAYFKRVLTTYMQLEPNGQAALDVGCGGGLLAEEFARLGCAVTGLDPSEPSLETARAHAVQSGLQIEYTAGVAEQLPFDDASFDVVYCCDVLDHVQNLDSAVAEAARILRPKGIYLYDTINRTLLSKLVMIKLFQEWNYTSFVEPNLHDWSMFIKPLDLRIVMSKHGLNNRGMKGLRPAGNPLTILKLLCQLKRGKISFREFGERACLEESDDLSVSYMGYAVKV